MSTYAFVNGNPLSNVDPLDLLAFAFNAGAHIWVFPWPGATGVNFSSNYVPGGDLSQSTSDVAYEVIHGELGDAGVSAGIAGLAPCQGDKP